MFKKSESLLKLVFCMSLCRDLTSTRWPQTRKHNSTYSNNATHKLFKLRNLHKEEIPNLHKEEISTLLWMKLLHFGPKFFFKYPYYSIFYYYLLLFEIFHSFFYSRSPSDDSSDAGRRGRPYRIRYRTCSIFRRFWILYNRFKKWRSFPRKSSDGVGKWFFFILSNWRRLFLHDKL